MKTSRLALVLALATMASQSVQANSDINYLSGGYQMSFFSEYIPTDINDHHNYLSGYYARASWGFTENVFLEIRRDHTAKNRLSTTHDVMGLGYLYSLDTDVSLYALAGFNQIGLEFSATSDDTNLLPSNSEAYIGVRETAFTAELGAKINLLSAWQIEPAARMATFDTNLYELRLGNTFSLTENVKLEANIAHRSIKQIDLTETNTQLGLRYAF